MGKSKSRILNKRQNKDNNVIKRTEIVQKILVALKKNSVNDEIKNLISLFGISTEELSEAGASLEQLSAIKPYIF